MARFKGEFPRYLALLCCVHKGLKLLILALTLGAVILILGGTDSQFAH